MTDRLEIGIGDAGSVLTAYEPAFLDLFPADTRLRALWRQGTWTEGPSYLSATRSVIFSDIPNDCQMHYSELSGEVNVWRGGQRHFVNGTTPDAAGGLLMCEHGTRSLTRLSHEGKREILADRFDGGRLNSPNDVVQHLDGSIWFTDPTYGIEFPDQGNPGKKEQEGSFVYRFDPKSEKLSAMIRDCAYPNGLAFSPDASRLYVADSGGSRSPGDERHIRVFDLGDNGQLSGGDIFVRCPNGVFDGFRVDRTGRLWASARDGVYIISERGTVLGRIATPETVSNLCFGGPDQDRLYITATSSLLVINLAHPV
ncbi:gluconolactonase [Cohaesibacter sp. ES.047]|uniref:SMP-30/gluconolactonase/LRE family protein n=1 Tax=Cohaesibacter sp. ES.047 TaxID=1798205 RepID=UPI000BB7103F|nr:SMP-30/gluconolactonase/LRE family protein [Cohaesibacter sp. ES.047]SNY92254.1 gluconolactonase [Cohaesibacter sp. ES.047]